MRTDTSGPMYRPFFKRSGRRYLIGFARGRPSNPARTPDGPKGRWHDPAGWTPTDGRPRQDRPGAPSAAGGVSSRGVADFTPQHQLRQSQNQEECGGHHHTAE